MTVVTQTLKAKLIISAVALLCYGHLAYAQNGTDVAPPPSSTIPLPDPLPEGVDPNNPLAVPTQPTPSTNPAQSQSGVGDGTEPVEIRYDTDILPMPVKRMRELIMDASRTGDLEALRPLLGNGANITQLSFGDVGGDPIEYLRSGSGDAEGHEMAAILLEVMEAGYVVFDEGTPDELYVWPYFTAIALESLTPKQRVELFKLVTAGDYEDMLSFGAYIFFRVGITAQGRWLFFVAGD